MGFSVAVMEWLCWHRLDGFLIALAVADAALAMTAMPVAISRPRLRRPGHWCCWAGDGGPCS